MLDYSIGTRILEDVLPSICILLAGSLSIRLLFIRFQEMKYSLFTLLNRPTHEVFRVNYFDELHLAF